MNKTKAATQSQPGPGATPPERAADRSPASGTVDDLATVAKAKLGRIPKAKRPKRTPEEQRAEIERVAKEHGADLSEEAFNKILRKVGSVPSTDRDRNSAEKR